MNISSIKSHAQALADNSVGIDMSQAKKAESFLFPEGAAIGRFVEYIEFGMQPQEFQGKAKPAKMNIRLGFALYGEGYAKEDGTPRVISSFDFPLDNSEKSKAYTIFSRMNAKKLYKNFGQMIGDLFIVNIKHKVDSKGIVRANLDLSAIGPAIDPMTRKPYQMPDAPDNLYRVFLWNNPTPEMWESLYIEGNKDDGSTKNFLQEKCLNALDYQGSKLQEMLEGPMPSLEQNPYEPTPFDDDDIPL